MVRHSEPLPEVKQALRQAVGPWTLCEQARVLNLPCTFAVAEARGDYLPGDLVVIG
jgi:hypothetical protein